MTDTPSPDHDSAAAAFQRRVHTITWRRSPHGWLLGLAVEAGEPGLVRTRVPYHPVFVGDPATGVIHGGVVTTMLDESCGAAVQLALAETAAIATLDLRIDYMRPATPGLDIQARAECYRVTKSIAFVRAIAFQGEESTLVASAAATFMIGANRTDMMNGRDPKSLYDALPPLETPGAAGACYGESPYTRFLGIAETAEGMVMPWDKKLTGNPMLPAIHGGVIGAFLETTAIVGVGRTIDGGAQPRPIGLTINYLRSGRPLTTYGAVNVVKQGRRVVAFEARAWQNDPASPIATAFGHFLLKADGASKADTGA